MLRRSANNRTIWPTISSSRRDSLKLCSNSFDHQSKLAFIWSSPLISASFLSLSALRRPALFIAAAVWSGSPSSGFYRTKRASHREGEGKFAFCCAACVFVGFSFFTDTHVIICAIIPHFIYYVSLLSFVSLNGAEESQRRAKMSCALVPRLTRPGLHIKTRAVIPLRCRG